MAREFYLFKDNSGGTFTSGLENQWELASEQNKDRKYPEKIHVIEYSAYENLKKIIAKEVSENDEFGSEFVIAQILRAENERLKKL